MPLLGAGEAQLLPAGEFSARDGRPGPGKKWRVNDAQGLKLATSLNAVAQLTPIVIDYDHQTLRAEKNGQKAPAAGWIKSVEWRAGTGLFARVDWTATAQAEIDEKKYLYISPVITYDDAGTVTGVLLAALVNYPAVTGMNAAVSALASQVPHPDPTHDSQESDMALLAALLALAGLPANTTEAQAIDHFTALNATVATLKAKPAVPVALSAALGLAATVDEAAALSAVAALKSTDAPTLQLITTLQAQVATLATAAADRALTELVDGAIAAQKYTPAMREPLLGIGRKDMASLQALITVAPVIPGLSGQSGGKGPGDPQASALTAASSEVMQQFGLSAEQFAKGATATG